MVTAQVISEINDIIIKRKVTIEDYGKQAHEHLDNTEKYLHLRDTKSILESLATANVKIDHVLYTMKQLRMEIEKKMLVYPIWYIANSEVKERAKRISDYLNECRETAEKLYNRVVHVNDLTHDHKVPEGDLHGDNFFTQCILLDHSKSPLKEEKDQFYALAGKFRLIKIAQSK